jgi:hypothetical protein
MNLITSLHVFSVNCSAGLCKVPASQLEEKELKAYRKIEQDEMNTLLNQYMTYCRLYLKVQAETLVIEKNNVANGIVELINQHSITKLVMGMSSFSTKRKVPKSKVAAIVHQQAKPYCQIFFICKGSLACTRDANLDSIKADSPRSSSASTLSDETELPARSVSLPPGHPGYMGSPDQPFLPRRSNSVSYPSPVLIANNVERMLHIAQHSIHVKPRNLSPNSSHPSNEGSSSSSLKDLDSMDGSPLPASIVSSEEQQMPMVKIFYRWKLACRMKCLSNCSKSAMSWNAQERKHLRAGRKPKGICLKHPGSSKHGKIHSSKKRGR